LGKVNSEHYWLFNQVVQPTSFGSCLNASKAESMPTIDIFQRMHLLYLIYYKMVEAFNHIILTGFVVNNLLLTSSRLLYYDLLHIALLQLCMSSSVVLTSFVKTSFVEYP